MLIWIVERVLSSSWDVSTCPWLKGTLLSYALLRLCDSSRNDDRNYGAAKTQGASNTWSQLYMWCLDRRCIYPGFDPARNQRQQSSDSVVWEPQFFAWLANGLQMTFPTVWQCIGAFLNVESLWCKSKVHFSSCASLLWLPLGGGFRYFLFSPLVGEDFQFDEHIFQIPPTSPVALTKFAPSFEPASWILTSCHHQTWETTICLLPHMCWTNLWLTLQ